MPEFLAIISRIENGQQRASTETLRRLAEALDGYAVIEFDFEPDGAAEPELVRCNTGRGAPACPWSSTTTTPPPTSRPRSPTSLASSPALSGVTTERHE